jgi:hypothetical protein
MNQYLATMALLGLLAYVALDVSTHLMKKTAMETGRRVFAISVLFTVSVYSLSILYGGVSGIFPLFGGPSLTAVWMLSLAAVMVGAWKTYHKALAHSKLDEGPKVIVVDYCTERLNGSVKPLADEITGLQSSYAGMLGGIEALGEKVEGLSSAVEAEGKSIESHSQTIASMSEMAEFRSEQFNAVIDGYKEWYQEHKKDQEIIYGLTKEAENVLERFGVLSEEFDEYLEFFREERDRSLPSETMNAHDIREPGPEIGTNTIPTKAGAEQSDTTAGSSPGKLTREAGMANREKGNRAQLQFSETILRVAGKLHACSLREGEPDYLFNNPDTHLPKDVGAFKALTLSEDGTRQRWIPKKKLLAEIKAATKFGLPIVLFVLNLANGRIWAKVIAIDEVRGFEGITTPLMLVENDPASEKACRETLDMALQLL